MTGAQRANTAARLPEDGQQEVMSINRTNEKWEKFLLECRDKLHINKKGNNIPVYHPKLNLERQNRFKRSLDVVTVNHRGEEHQSTSRMAVIN